MAKRDVDLVIRAKNAASKAIDSVKDSLKELTSAQDAVGKSASGADSLLGQLGAELQRLNREVQGLAALDKVSSSLDRATAAVGRLENEVASATDDFSRLGDAADKAARSTARLQEQASASGRAYERQKNLTRGAREEQAAVNAEVKRAESEYRRLFEAVRGAAQPSEALKNALRGQRDTLISLYARQSDVTAEWKRQQVAQRQARSEFNGLNQAVKTAERSQRGLATQAGVAADALEQQKQSLGQARSDLGEISGVATKASTALGGVAASQDKVAAASKRASEDIQKVGEALKRQVQKPAAVTVPDRNLESYKTQVEAVNLTRRAWQEARIEASRLGQAISKAETPTREMQTAFLLARAAAKEARTEYEAQANVLNRLRGVTQGTFASFSQAASQMRQSAASASAAQQQTEAAARQGAKTQTQLGAETDRTGAAMGRTAQRTHGFRGALAGLYGESRRSMSIMQRLRGEVLALATSYLGLYSVVRGLGGVITSYQTLEATQNRLGAVFDQDVGRVATEIEWLERQARRLGISFGILSNEYGKFTVAAKTANFTNAETRKIFLSVAEAARVNKLSLDQMSGVFLALQQMISKGKVASEELRRQLGDRLTGAFHIFAQAIGVTTEELDEMLKAGEVIADRSTLLKFADQLDKRFGGQLNESLRSVTTELGRFSDGIYQAQLRVAEGGFIDALANGLRRLNRFFYSREGRDFFLAIGAAVGKFINALVAASGYLDEIILLAKIFIGLRLAQTFSGLLVRSVGALSKSYRDLSVSMSAVGPGMAAAGRAQGVLAASTIGLIGHIDRMRKVMVVTAGVSGGAARAGAIAYAGALTGLRTAVIGTAAVLRGLFTALGGWVGIAITALTFVGGKILGDMLTEVDSLTKAMDEHSRIVNEVVAAYEDAGKSAGDWRSRIKDVTLDQATASARSLKEELASSREELDEYGNVLSNTGLLFKGAGRDVLSLRTQFLQGRVSTEEFRKGLEQLYATTNDDGLRRYLEDLLKVVRRHQDTERSSKQAELVLRSLSGSAGEAAEAMKELGGATEEVVGPTEDLTKIATEFADALNDLKDGIPQFDAELKRTKGLKEIQKDFDAAIEKARSFDEVTKAYSLRQLRVDALNQSVNRGAATGGNLADRIIQAESGGKANAKNPRSTATGAGQFIESTWLKLFRQYFPDRAESMSREAILALRKDAEVSRRMIEIYASENAALLQKAGVAVNDAALYLAHFLGPNGAIKVLSAAPNTPVADLLGGGQIAANPSVLGGGKSAQQVIQWAAKKVGITEEELAVQREIEKSDEKRLDIAEKFNAAITERITNNEFEITQTKRAEREQAVQKALWDAVNSAQEKGLKISDAQREAIIRTTGALYDAQNAEKKKQEDRERAEKRVNDLLSIRGQLQQQLDTFVNQGAGGQVAQTEQAISSIDERLKTAIQSAREMWEALGGEDAEVALTRLSTLELTIGGAKDKAIFLGLTMNDLSQSAQNFAQGGANAFDNFIKGVSEGKAAIESLGVAFLQFASDFLRQMAQMILQQVILNALKSSFPGASFLPTGHTGGVVGSRSIGSGNGMRRVAAGLFSHATRYHGGGVAGLRPGEVPAVLKQGEEVLTEDDPRHIFNAGQGGGGGQPTSIRNVLVLDPNLIPSSMSSSSGERVVMQHIKANAPTIKQMLR